MSSRRPREAPGRTAAECPPNRLWADNTYLKTWEGWLYLVAVQDVYSRRIVGWSIADHMRAELVTDGCRWRTRKDLDLAAVDGPGGCYPSGLGLPEVGIVAVPGQRVGAVGAPLQNDGQLPWPGTTFTTARMVVPPNGPPTIDTVIVWAPEGSGRTRAA